MKKYNQYHIKQISKEDIPAFTNLYNLVFNKKFNSDVFKKKFETNWAKRTYIGYLAFHENGEIAAYYGVYPSILKVNEKIHFSAQSAETMTHPNHRRKGLFKVLMDETLSLCKSENIELIYGFPNSNSYPQFMKSGWKHSENIIRYNIPVKLTLAQKIFRKINNTHYQTTALKILRGFEKNKFSNWSYEKNIINQLFHPRIQEYIEYKEFKNNFRVFTKYGEALVSWKYNDLLIGEFQVNDKEKNQSFWTELINIGVKIGANNLILDSTEENQVPSSITHFKIQGLPIIYYSLNPEIQNLKFNFTGLDFDTF